MFDLTQSYTLSFVLGGILCVASAVTMIQPYLYIKNNLAEVELDLPEKMALSSSFEFGETQYPSVLNVSHVTVSLEVIPISSRDDLKDEPKLGSLDVLPATKRLLELKKYPSTASV